MKNSKKFLLYLDRNIYGAFVSNKPVGVYIHLGVT